MGVGVFCHGVLVALEDPCLVAVEDPCWMRLGVVEEKLENLDVVPRHRLQRVFGCLERAGKPIHPVDRVYERWRKIRPCRVFECGGVEDVVKGIETVTDVDAGCLRGAGRAGKVQVVAHFDG